MIGPDPTATAPGPQGEEGEDWLATYADAITLLMAFFVMLLSMAVIDQRKYEEVSEGIKKELNHHRVIPTEPSEEAEPVKQNLAAVVKEAPDPRTISEDLATSLETLKTSDSCKVETTEESVTIAFQGESLYPAASADLRPSALKVLNDVAVSLKGISLETYTITVEGHTDDARIRSPRFPSNWELSSQRATAVVRHLIDQGVDPAHLQGIAYAHTRPVAPNRADNGDPITANRAQNRRVVIRIER